MVEYAPNFHQNIIPRILKIYNEVPGWGVSNQKRPGSFQITQYGNTRLCDTLLYNLMSKNVWK